MPRSQLDMHARAVLAIGVVVCLAVAACATKTTPTTGLGDVSPPAVMPGSSTPAPSAPPTVSPTATPGQNHGGSTGTHQSPSAPPSLAGVSVTLMTHPAVTYSSYCPYADKMTTDITVDRAIDLTYQFWHNGKLIHTSSPVHLDAAGTYATNWIAEDSPASLKSMDDRVVALGPDGRQAAAHRTFRVMCVPNAGDVTADPATSLCPYTTTFSVKVSVVVGPERSHYKWIFQDGSTITGTLEFPGTGPQSQILTATRTVKPSLTGVSAQFTPDEHIDPSGPVTATCTI